MRHYFVDEAGDGNLFDAKGRCIVKTTRCSEHFILGFADIEDPQRVATALNDLRSQLLADPFLADIPSMQAAARKTALFFHAKDDSAQVRHEVFKLLRSLGGIHFHAVVMNKWRVLQFAQEKRAADPLYRHKATDLYHYMAGRLLQNKMHKDTDYSICVAKRGKINQTKALKHALFQARDRFLLQNSITSKATISIRYDNPVTLTGLQITDYLLWALQRYYEREEKGYVRVQHLISSICYDDYRQTPQKTTLYYHKKRPLLNEWCFLEILRI